MEIRINSDDCTDAVTVQPGMRLYRLPTEILWVNDGWREFEARDADNAMAVYRQRWSNSANHVGLANLQIKLGDGWRFAGETPSYLGGYSRKS